jgi:hypothetical protein
MVHDHHITRPGKHTKNYGKSPFFMGKSTISMAMFNSYLLNNQRVSASNSPSLSMIIQKNIHENHDYPIQSPFVDG